MIEVIVALIFLSIIPVVSQNILAGEDCEGLQEAVIFYKKGENHGRKDLVEVQWLWLPYSAGCW